MGVCQGIHDKFIVRTNSWGKDLDLRRCRTCQSFLKFDGIRCPCCGNKVRTNSRIAAYRDNHKVIRWI